MTHLDPAELLGSAGDPSTLWKVPEGCPKFTACPLCVPAASAGQPAASQEASPRRRGHGGAGSEGRMLRGLAVRARDLTTAWLWGSEKEGVSCEPWILPGALGVLCRMLRGGGL